MAIQLESDKTIVFFGDSITDCGRRGGDKPLGSGYVKLFAELLSIREPEKEITIINKGIGGHKITDLQSRLEDDVIRHNPDLVSFLIGINDLHTHYRNVDGGVDPEKFETTYDEVLCRIKTALPDCQLVIMSPFFMSISTSPNSYRTEILKLLVDYVNIAKKMSEKYQATYIDLQECYETFLNYREADEICPEPVHPNHTGHLLIAEQIYHALSK